ncbi:MAG: hypothetical protein EHM19_00775 [Candidatus Latescibacterota bacterium]|nr:MAG: hypothetical protein EHM19_00775 [Candidatus Latescibacterota bacterium]
MKASKIVFAFVPLLFLLLAPAGAFAQSATATGISRNFNPAISLNALLLYAGGLTAAEEEHAEGEAEAEEHAHAHGTGEGFAIQETELQVTSYVDPYVKANLVLAMHGTDGFELEEGFGQALFLPRGLGLRAGKFYFEFGKHNSYHTHQYPFVERPYAWDTVLGAHGLNGAAIEATWLTPLPIYTEILATAFPLTETVYGAEELPENTWGRAAKLRNFFETSEHTTIDFGISYAGGEGVENVDRHFFAVDGTFKFIGTGSYPKKLELQGEWMRRFEEEGVNEVDGAYAHALARVTRRWHVGARWDGYFPPPEDHDAESHLEEKSVLHEHEEAHDIHTYTASLAFVPSEFQALRVDVLHRDLGEETDQAVRVQYNFTIGSHPSHPE